MGLNPFLMKRTILSLSLLLIFALSGISQQKTPMELTDVFDLEYVSDPQISPDGSRVVYVRNFKDIMTDQNLSNLWIANFDGTGHRPLTTGNHAARSPRWSHDGKRIAFLSNMADEKTKLYLMWVDDRETMAATSPFRCSCLKPRQAPSKCPGNQTVPNGMTPLPI